MGAGYAQNTGRNGHLQCRSQLELGKTPFSVLCLHLHSRDEFLESYVFEGLKEGFHQPLLHSDVEHHQEECS